MKKICFLLGLGLLSGIAFGQVNSNATASGFCAQHTLQKKRMSDPAFAAKFNAAQAQLAAHEEAMKSSDPVRSTVYKIPVVFHVLHTGGFENISREQMLSAVAILNRDFRLQNTDAATVHDDFKASNPSATCIPTDAEIEFVLATKAPDGTCFNGITRTYSSMTNSNFDSEGQYQAAAYGNDVYQGEWSHENYLNIIVAKTIGEGAAGYTYLPWGGGTPYNCIFMLHNYVGDIGTSSPYTSRALTHEVGHWLNLSHTWGDQDPGTSCDGTDYVADTPTTRGSSWCNLNENECGPRANVENYMDYSYCSKMFSGGQVDRMRAAITSSVSDRNNIWTPSNLAAVGADGNLNLCAAKFSASRTAVCAGEEITFTDESFNIVTGRTWTFTGGSPATSTDANPVVTYSTPGTYTVKLVATDGTSSDTEEKTAYITVMPSSATLPYYESFEGLSALAPVWIAPNDGGGAGWTLSASTGSSGTKSAALNNFNQEPGDVDEMASQAIDLSEINATDKVTLSFRYAFRRTDESNNDILKVLISNNCGDSWEIRKTMTNLSSQTAMGPWLPASSDFETVHMTNITSIFWVENFRFKFQFLGGGGNNLHLDDINIYEGPPSETIVVGLDEIAEFQHAVAFPNPADKEVNVRFTAAKGQPVKLSITDLTGKLLGEQVINAAQGSNLVMMSTEELASGMYLIRFNEGSQTLNFIVK